MFQKTHTGEEFQIVPSLPKIRTDLLAVPTVFSEAAAPSSFRNTLTAVTDRSPRAGSYQTGTTLSSGAAGARRADTPLPATSSPPLRPDTAPASKEPNRTPAVRVTSAPGTPLRLPTRLFPAKRRSFRKADPPRHLPGGTPKRRAAPRTAAGSPGRAGQPPSRRRLSPAPASREGREGPGCGERSLPQRPAETRTRDALCRSAPSPRFSPARARSKLTFEFFFFFEEI